VKSPWVNFINVKRAAFTCKDPKSAKKAIKLSVYFALWRSALAKAAGRTLMILPIFCSKIENVLKAIFCTSGYCFAQFSFTNKTLLENTTLSYHQLLRVILYARYAL